MVIKCGETKDLQNRYKFLEDIAYSLYPDAKIKYRWCTEDTISLDKIPYIGELSELMPNAYVATGFKKWGLTSSHIAANIITDKIKNKDNPYKEIFRSSRFEPIKNHEELGNMIKESISSLVIDKLKLPEEDVSSIPNGSYKIIDYNHSKLGIYKDETGKQFTVKPICSHLGCLLEFNELEKTWDCPCHGSRYLYDGTSIYSPGMKDLEKYEL